MPLIVDIQGDVYRPGIMLLNHAATVFEAIPAAGGLHPRCLTDPSQVLASRPLRSGERVWVICEGGGAMQIQVEPVEAGVRLTLGEKLDVNQAGVEELCLVPGLQPVMAAAIVTRRCRQPWVDLQELSEISGVGPKTLEKWGNYLEVPGTGTANRLRQPNNPHRRER
jgi:DNA uptake protein ComE-like DNA-binding protein